MTINTAAQPTDTAAQPTDTTAQPADTTVQPADTGARTTEAADAISGDRARIDDLDRRILELVQERVAVSEGIQRARIASGGRRISLARETEVIGTYSGRLGRPGTVLAMALLELGRGRV